MKKILLMSVLCLAIIACGKKEEAKQEMAETRNVTQECGSCQDQKQR